MKIMLGLLLTFGLTQGALAGGNSITCSFQSRATNNQLVLMKSKTDRALLIFEDTTDNFSVHINISRFGDPDAQVMINDMKSALSSRGIISIPQHYSGQTQLALQDDAGRFVAVFCKYK